MKFVNVWVDQDEDEVGPHLARRPDLAYSMHLLDPDEKTRATLDFTVVPRVVVIDAKGRLQYSGWKPDVEELETVIAKAKQAK